MIMRILFGFIGLGIVVFIHEAGHFIAAKLLGIQVEVFSIGWGPRLAGFRRRETEYRISLLPFGGFCKLKGEEALRKAWAGGGEALSAEPGSFYSAAPWRRMLVGAAGPVFNFIFALAAFSLVWLIGFSYPTFDGRIILESDFKLNGQHSVYPASEAGLATGDRIVAIDGAPVATYRDIQEAVSRNPDRILRVEAERNGARLAFSVKPELNKSTGAGRIGIYAWIDPLIEEVRRDSAAFIAGLKPGDRLLELNGKPLRHSLDVTDLLMKEGKDPVGLLYERAGQRLSTRLIVHHGENGAPDIGLAFRPIIFTSPRLSLTEAVGRGLAETMETLGSSVSGILHLFRGIDLSQAMAGPLKITYFVGEVASQGFSRGLASGVTALLNFLGLLSIALFFMNLLPIPALDGGQILLFVIEALRGKPMKPVTIYRYQFVGVIFIFGLLIFTTVSDLSFLITR